MTKKMKIKSSTNLLLIKMSIVLFIPVGLLVFGMNYYANQCMENVVKRIAEIYASQQESPQDSSLSTSGEAASEENESAFP